MPLKLTFHQCDHSYAKPNYKSLDYGNSDLWELFFLKKKQRHGWYPYIIIACKRYISIGIFRWKSEKSIWVSSISSCPSLNVENAKKKKNWTLYYNIALGNSRLFDGIIFPQFEQISLSNSRISDLPGPEQSYNITRVKQQRKFVIFSFFAKKTTTTTHNTPRIITCNHEIWPRSMHLHIITQTIFV